MLVARYDWGFRLEFSLKCPGVSGAARHLGAAMNRRPRLRAKPIVTEDANSMLGGHIPMFLLELPSSPGLCVCQVCRDQSDTSSWILPREEWFRASAIRLVGRLRRGEPAEVFPTTQRTLQTNISFAYIVIVSWLRARAMRGLLRHASPPSAMLRSLATFSG